ncbi:MAG: macro domain-containing protein [Anaerolineaceae bacterium]
MIRYVKGDLLEAPERMILHGCNCRGVMGSGVAKLIREKWPQAYEDYREKYNRDGLELGSMVVSVQDDEKVIINAMTQDGYGKTGVHVSYWAVATIAEKCGRIMGGQSIAIPKIGAGLGGGDWNVIAAILENEAPDVEWVVYEI